MTAWLAMTPETFDTQAPETQQAMFVKPDPLGTPDMFAGLDASPSMTPTQKGRASSCGATGSRSAGRSASR